MKRAFLHICVLLASAALAVLTGIFTREGERTGPYTVHVIALLMIVGYGGSFVWALLRKRTRDWLLVGLATQLPWMAGTVIWGAWLLIWRVAPDWEFMPPRDEPTRVTLWLIAGALPGLLGTTWGLWRGIKLSEPGPRRIAAIITAPLFLVPLLLSTFTGLFVCHPMSTSVY